MNMSFFKGGPAGSKAQLADANFFLLAVPRDRCRNAQDVTASKVGTSAISVTSFPLEELRVGTLDSLMALSDDIGKIDTFVGSTCRKIAKLAFDMASRGQLDGTLAVHDRDVSSFVRDFKWDLSQYNIKSSLRDIVNVISQDVTALDSEFRKKSQSYQTVLNAVKAAERKKDSTLASRPLDDIIEPKLHVIETEHLTTLFVVVSNNNARDWESKYETLLQGLAEEEAKAEAAQRADREAKEAEAARQREETRLERDRKLSQWRVNGTPEDVIRKEQDKWAKQDEAAARASGGSGAASAAALSPEQLKDKQRLAAIKSGGWVVPRSSLKITSDKDFSLYRVVLFKALADDFRAACGKSKMFQVREYNAKAAVAAAAAAAGSDGDESGDLAAQERAMMTWCKRFFGEAYSAWVHLKVIRLYIEMILRYGLPARSGARAISESFSAVLVEFDKKNRDRISKTIDSTFKFLQPKHLADAKDDEESSFGSGEKMLSCAFTAIELDTSTSN